MYTSHYMAVLRRAIRMQRRRLLQANRVEVGAAEALAALQRLQEDATRSTHASVRRQYEHAAADYARHVRSARTEREKHERQLFDLQEQQRVVVRKRYAQTVVRFLRESDALTAARVDAAFADFD